MLLADGMKIVTDLKHFNKQECLNLVVALGNFDGVHLGHQEIIKTVSERARRIGGVSAVFTFKEHPQRVLHQKEDPQILTSWIHKLSLLKQLGLDVCFLIDFTVAFSKKNPEEFVTQVLMDRLGAREICLGFNARFGHDRSGDSTLMNQLARKHGFVFLEAAPFMVNGAIVSSSKIRSFIQEGKLAEAEQLLGRPYSFFASIVSGSGRGKKLGFPTANLDPHSEVMPPQGVYAVWIRVLDCRLENGSLIEGQAGDYQKAVLNYGLRPTFGDSSKPVPEVHILDRNQDLKGHSAEVTIGERLRGERTFDHEDALKLQIAKDIEQSRNWFATHSCH